MHKNTERLCRDPIVYVNAIGVPLMRIVWETVKESIDVYINGVVLFTDNKMTVSFVPTYVRLYTKHSFS